MNLFSISGISVGISCVALSLIVLFFGKTPLHRLLFFFNAVVAVWGFGLFFAGIAATEQEALFGWKFANIGGFFVGPAFYHMTSVFCGINRKKIIYFAYLQAVIFAILAVTTDILFNINTLRFVFDMYFHVLNPFYLIAVISYLLFVILSYYELFKFFPQTQGYKRTQTLYIIFGFSIGFIGATSSFLPMFKVDAIYPFGNFGITIYCIILTYAILRRKLLDIHFVLKKTMVYSLSAGLLTGLFIVIVLTITNLFSVFTHTGSFKISIAAALVIAFLFTPLKDKIQMIIDRTFYKTPYDYYDSIQRASREFASTINMEHIQKFIVNTVSVTLGLRSACILSQDDKYFKTAYCRALKDADKKMIYESRIESDSVLVQALIDRRDIVFKRLFEETADSPAKEGSPAKADNGSADAIKKEFDAVKCEAAVPIFIDEKLTFLLLLGEKLSGDIFSAEDVDLLSTMAGQAAVSLKNALLYEELKLKVRQLEQAELQVKTSLQEKEMLLREVHHRVKNNMQVIYSMLSLQAKLVKDKSYKGMLIDSQHRIRTMTLIHEKLYQSADLAHVNFNDYVNDLARDLFRSYGVDTDNIMMTTDIKGTLLGIDTAIPCGLIINELLSNSLKHAFPEDRKGKITISFNKINNDEFELIVSDDGIGMPQDIDFRNTESLGLRLVTILAENQLRGKIEFNRTNGTEFRIRFKEVQYEKRI
jgi:two-component sensor histidine kinase